MRVVLAESRVVMNCVLTSESEYKYTSRRIITLARCQASTIRLVFTGGVCCFNQQHFINVKNIPITFVICIL